MPSRLRTIILLSFVLLSLGLSPHLAADSSDQDRARHALEAGEILPLSDILKRIEGNYPGQIIEVELDQDEEQWQYKIKLLRSNGSLIKMKIDASNGELLGIKGRDIKPEQAQGGKP